MKPTKKYKCLECGLIVTGEYRENENRGSHFKAVCKCGNQGLSGFHLRCHDITGFEGVENEEDRSKKRLL